MPAALPLGKLLGLTKDTEDLNFEFGISNARYLQTVEGVKMQRKADPKEPLALKRPEL